MSRSAHGSHEVIHLEPVDELTITILVDNATDIFPEGPPPVTRALLGALPWTPVGHYTEGEGPLGLRAEHGFAALVELQRGSTRHTLLFDTGLTSDGLRVNGERLGVDPTAIEALVLSHGHFDHTGGIEGLARWRGARGLPILLHPVAWTTRRQRTLVGTLELPSLSRKALDKEGFVVLEREEPSVLVDGMALVTGEIPRVTEFETGAQGHEARGTQGWAPDPLILDDQALVVKVAGKGLVVLTGCGHAGVVNTLRHAVTLTDTTTVAAVVGGFHLNTQAALPAIEPTVTALAGYQPGLVVAGHCTGWRAFGTLARVLGDAFTPSTVGTRIHICSDAAATLDP